MTNSTETRIPVSVGKGHQLHWRRDKNSTVCGKVGELVDREWAIERGASCRACTGVSAMFRRIR